MNHLRMVSLVSMLCLLITSCVKKSDVTTIGYLQIAQDPSLDVAKNALFQALADSGFFDGTNIKIIDNNAQGDLSMIPSILQSFISQRVDIIVTNATPCMISAAQMVKEIPVVFTVSFSPQDMGITPIPENMYGVYDPYNVVSFIDLMVSLKPNINKVGIPYNNAERNAEYSARLIIEELDKRNIDVVTVAVNSSNDILNAGNYLTDRRVDVIVVAADNVVNLGLSLLGKVGSENKIPIFVTESINAVEGAAIGYGVSYEQWGYKAGLKVIELLKGSTIPASEKITPLDTMVLLINIEAAKGQGLNIPEDLLKKAYKVY